MNEELRMIPERIARTVIKSSQVGAVAGREVLGAGIVLITGALIRFNADMRRSWVSGVLLDATLHGDETVGKWHYGIINFMPRGERAEVRQALDHALAIARHNQV